ncbi:hypothetical protein T11_4071, partial [Trichinella zimbabwensis]
MQIALLCYELLWLDLCEISLQWHRTLNAVLGYALALRGGRRGLDLTLH